MNQEDVYRHLVAHGPLTVPELAESLGGSATNNSLQHKITQLRKWGMVREVGTRSILGRDARVWEAVVGDE